ncbi:unnamed protein product [Allacma fusca]|uniref:AB hydrolase-1 domain-containing protein n=1 Tax=Allacma fusca TaxID=39272 RepID=A0A8J2KIB9_9HEXA|nr:unnamed protein product [Allacma fusca]
MIAHRIEMGWEQAFTEIAIQVPWGHVSGKTWGDVNGIPVLGLHGWTDNAGTFDRLAPLLPKSLYFVAIDLPGHGRSSHHPEGLLPNLVVINFTLHL